MGKHFHILVSGHPDVELKDCSTIEDALEKAYKNSYCLLLKCDKHLHAQNLMGTCLEIGMYCGWSSLFEDFRYFLFIRKIKSGV